MKTLGLKGGKEFDRVTPQEVTDFLQSRSLIRLEVEPERLHIANDGKSLLLQISNGSFHEYPLRKSFLFKLLRWFSFPLSQIQRLNIDTVTSVLNDFLLSIRSGNVTVTIEEGDALTITSSGYSLLPDLDVFVLCRSLGVERVSRNDFFTRLYTEIRSRKEIVKGDDCGFGYNVLNSETGFRSVSVNHYILRYVCTNGAVIRRVSKKDERTHYGCQSTELREWLAEQLLGAEEEYARLAASLQASVSTKAGGRDFGLARSLAGVIGRGAAREIVENISAESSLFDVFNLVTHEAKQFDVSRRFQMEMIAGDLIQTVTPETEYDVNSLRMADAKPAL